MSEKTSNCQRLDDYSVSILLEINDSLHHLPNNPLMRPLSRRQCDSHKRNKLLPVQYLKWNGHQSPAHVEARGRFPAYPKGYGLILKHNPTSLYPHRINRRWYSHFQVVLQGHCYPSTDGDYAHGASVSIHND